MISFLRLLLDEPDRAESLVIVLLRFLVTIALVNHFFGFQDLLPILQNGEFAGGSTISEILYLVITVVLVWQVLWRFLADAIPTLLVNWVGSKIKIEEVIPLFLRAIGVTEKGSPRPMPGKNADAFAEFLESISEGENPITHSRERINQYWTLFLAAFAVILLTNTESISWILVALVSYFSLNFLLAGILLTAVLNYMYQNFASLQLMADRLAYSRAVLEVLAPRSHGETMFKVVATRRGFRLEPGTEESMLPLPINIWVAIGRDQAATQYELERGLKKRMQVVAKAEHEEYRKGYHIVITDIAPKEIAFALLNQPRLAYIHAEGLDQLLARVDLAWRQLPLKRHPILNEHSQ